MKLSTLQKFILKQCFKQQGGMISKKIVIDYYRHQKSKPSAKDIITVITRSVDRLIRNELVIGYGWKTPHQWRIQEIRLTPKGRITAKKLFGSQLALPLKVKRK